MRDFDEAAAAIAALNSWLETDGVGPLEGKVDLAGILRRVASLPEHHDTRLFPDACPGCNRVVTDPASGIGWRTVFADLVQAHYVQKAAESETCGYCERGITVLPQTPRVEGMPVHWDCVEPAAAQARDERRAS
jgi:hypothetical protein